MHADRAAEADGETFTEEEVAFIPPMTDRNTVYCAALNYEAHAEESDIAVPE